MISVGFQSKKCDHGELTMSERKLRVCMNAVLDDPDDVDGLCSGFQSIRECLTSNLKDCFPEDYVQKITKDFFCQKLK